MGVMAVRDQIRIADGFLSLQGGIDSGLLPTIIGIDQASWAVNSTFRGGYWSHRPGFVRQPLTFAQGIQQTAFEEGSFQGARRYQSDNCHPFACPSISGRIFKVNLNTFETEELVPPSPNASLLPKVWFCQAEKYLIIQNAQDPALIFNGQTIRRSKGIDGQEVPNGGPMAYGRGRLWVARKHEYLGGDLLYSGRTRAAIIRVTSHDGIS